MCNACFKRSLSCYTPATDEMLPQDWEDYRDFRRTYDDWLDDQTDDRYEEAREERDYE